MPWLGGVVPYERTDGPCARRYPGPRSAPRSVHRPGFSQCSSPDMNFFFQNKAALDDEGFFHHRKYCRIAFLPNGRRNGFDLTANRSSFDLHPVRGSALHRRKSRARALRWTCTISPATVNFDTVRSSAWSGICGSPDGGSSDDMETLARQKADTITSNFSSGRRSPPAPDDPT